MKFFATTGKGMEALLEKELALFGAQERLIRNAGVSFEGTLEVAYRACLWSRIANRILLPLKTFSASNPDELYGGIRSIHWTNHLTSSQTFSVDLTTTQSKITHSHYGALKVKDAIVDQFRAVQGQRPSIDTRSPDLRINVYLNHDQAIVSIDLSGDSLHQRGYREESVAAPLKENLAAAILMSTDWGTKALQGDVFPLPPLIDGMTGSGTLVIEAALMAAKIPPGFLRKRFGFSKWLGHQPKIWKTIQEESRDLEIQDLKKLPRIVGYDENPKAIYSAIHNIENAGLTGRIHVEKKSLKTYLPLASQGTFIANPPYGERLGEVEDLKILYKDMGDLLKQKFQGWEAYIFTGSSELSKVIGLSASRRMVFFHGPIECRLLKYDLYAGTKV